MPTLYLIDGSAIAYRSHFAFSRTPLTSPTGEPTGAIFGTALFLNSLLGRPDLSHAACVFDARGPTFRHDLFSDYKATRQKMPDELAMQLTGIRELAEALGLPVLEMPGYEADDVIATLATQAAKRGFDVFIVSGDKDFGQLVNDRIRLMTPRSGGDMEVIDAAGVEKKWGVPPDKIVDFMGLMGDSSDHVPGVPKVGEKTAAELIARFGSLDETLARAAEVAKPVLRQNLLDFADQARLSRQLVTLDCGVPLPLDPDRLDRKPADLARLMDLYRRYGFHSLMEKLEVAPRAEAALDHQAVITPERLEKLLHYLRRGNPLSVDLETTSIDPMQSEIVGLSFAVEENEAFWIPACAGFFPQADDTLRRLGEPVPAETAWVLQKLRPILEDPKIRKTGQNLKFDALVLRCHGLELKGMVFDTMIASYLIDPSRRQHNLDSIALEYLNFKKIPISDLIGSGRKQISMREVPLEKITGYACEDADVALRLTRLLGEKIEQGGFGRLLRDLELPLVPVLADMEYHGMALDLDLLAAMSVDMSARLDQLTDDIYRLAGLEFNINSTQQLAHILFDKLQLKPVKRTKTGFSTDVEVLEKLAVQDPLPRALLEYRQIQKLKSTYVDALPRMVNPRTGRVHTSFNQTVTVTGRLSSSDPNLQNIPIRTDEGGAIRRAFIPGRDTQVILSADYSQIELRLMAHISGDRELISAFHEGRDVHTTTAARLMRVPESEVTPEMRRSAKAINFGVIYGMSDYGLSERLGIPLDVARQFRQQYFDTYPGVRAYMEETVARARRDKKVTTLLGRHRLLPDIDAKTRPVREFAERTAINTPIQGSAADMIKLAMIRLHDRLKKLESPLFPPPARMILQVHDELVFEVEREALPEVIKLVRGEMEGAMDLKVPIVADVGVGANWLEAH
ncbi:MAG: DNA polymerase I [Candidatus Zixiibacteriota bacterium]|nr:MAG: DNA polymerase I [candidate division Zixibacteria bacterium]